MSTNLFKCRMCRFRNNTVKWYRTNFRQGNLLIGCEIHVLHVSHSQSEGFLVWCTCKCKLSKLFSLTLKQLLTFLVLWFLLYLSPNLCMFCTLREGSLFHLKSSEIIWNNYVVFWLFKTTFHNLQNSLIYRVKTQEIAFQRLCISKFSWGQSPRPT